MPTTPNAILVELMSIGGDGPSVVIKDSIDIRGVRTRRGTRALDDVAPASSNAHVVDLLLAAGCRIVGKANMHELAFGATGINASWGTPINPAWPGHVPGGSSSGSAAAVAAGLVDFAIGTDTGGSIRIPAACCGVVGLKTTYGRISRRGIHPAISSLDCVGPLARNVAAIEAAMALIDPAFHRQKIQGPVPIGLLAVQADPWVVARVSAALAATGCDVRDVALKGFDAAFFACAAISAAETYSDIGRLIDDPRVGADIRERLKIARGITPDQTDQARAVGHHFRADVDRLLESFACLALPTLPIAVPTLDQGADPMIGNRLTDLVRQFNLSGHPVIGLPLAMKDQPPVGLQLVGAIGDDARLCAIARQVEAAVR